MFTTFDYIYYAIYLFCLYASFKAKGTSIPGLTFLRFILVFGLAIEAIVEILQFLKKDDTPPYYVYIPVEYCCLAFFYRQNTESLGFKKALLFSIPIYLIAAITLSIFHYRLSGYPSLLYNISCFFSTVWICLLLFNFNKGNGKEIWTHPLFIILSAFLIFFAGIFFFNPAYTYVQKKDPMLAANLRIYINTILNYILYILLSYGFLCSANTTKLL